MPQPTSSQVIHFCKRFSRLATASALCSIHVAADLDETIALLKNTVGAHEGANLDIEVAVGPIPLDTDVEGFETIAVSYFTVQPILFEGLTSRMLPVCMGISSVIFMDLGVFTGHMDLMSLWGSLIYWGP